MLKVLTVVNEGSGTGLNLKENHTSATKYGSVFL